MVKWRKKLKVRAKLYKEKALILGATIVILAGLVLMGPTVYFNRASRPPTDLPGVDPSFAEDNSKYRLSSQKVLDEYNQWSDTDNTKRNFKNPSLAFVDPRSPAGYESAKKYHTKFTHISPIWYKLKSHPSPQRRTVRLEGQFINLEFLSDMRRHPVKILPRVEINAHYDFLGSEEQQGGAVSDIISECRRFGYDGVVVEAWSSWSSVLHIKDMKRKALSFIAQLGDAMKIASLDLILLVVPPALDPYREKKIYKHEFHPRYIDLLSKKVEGFALLTYDYSNPYAPGPNAPLDWVKDVLSRLEEELAPKLFLGINFHGYHYSEGGSVMLNGQQYIAILQHHRPRMVWKSSWKEYYARYRDQHGLHLVYYPTVDTVRIRLELARRRGVGISVSDIVAGLDYFFVLL